jgi:hypothetical protein
VGAQLAPDARARTVHNVERLSPGAGILGGEREEVRTVLDMGEGQTGERADDDLERPQRLPEGGEVAVIAAPDEPWTEDGQVPPVPLGVATRDPLLPRLGDGVAVALVEVGNRLERRGLVERPADGAPVVHREAAGQDKPAAGRTGHGREEPLGPAHRRCELQVLPAAHGRREVDEHVHAVEGGLEVTGGAEVGPDDLD